MEAFSLLKYWRGGGGRVGGVGTSTSTNASNDYSSLNVETGNATIISAVAHTSAVTDDDEDDEDEGPFFDLEFKLPETAEDSEGDGRSEQNQNGGSSEQNSEDDGDENADDESDGDRELNVTLSSSSSNDRIDPDRTYSPAGDLFFKGKLVPIEHSSLPLNSSEPNSKHQFHVSLMKSATKFRVFMLGLKKQKGYSTTEKTENRNGSFSTGPKQQKSPSSEPPKKEPELKQAQQQQNKLFTVKFKAEEVPIMSLFTGDNSSRAADGSRSRKQTPEEQMSDEKRFSKDVMHKYLKKVKPLYVRVSRKYSDKMRFSGQLSFISSAATTKTGSGQPQPTSVQKLCPAKTTVENSSQLEVDAHSETPASNVKSQKLGNFPTGLKVVCKHLGKSRSASSVASGAPSESTLARRRDDSLLQQQDGIQSAILHCKRPFLASGDCDSSQLPRSVSDSLHEKASELSRRSGERST